LRCGSLAAPSMWSVRILAVGAASVILSKLRVATAVHAQVVSLLNAATSMRAVLTVTMCAASGVASESWLPTSVDACRHAGEFICLRSFLHPFIGVPPPSAQHRFHFSSCCKLHIIHFLDASALAHLDLP